MANKKYFLEATKEVEKGNLDEALWAKQLAVAKGDEEKAKYEYIAERAATLQKDATTRYFNPILKKYIPRLLILVGSLFVILLIIDNSNQRKAEAQRIENAKIQTEIEAAVREARIKKEKAEEEEKERAEQEEKERAELEKVEWDTIKQTYKTKNPLVLEKAAQLIKLGLTDFAVFQLFRMGLTDEVAARFEATKLQLETIKLGLTDDERAIRSIAIEARDKITVNRCQSFFYYIGHAAELAWYLRERYIPRLDSNGNVARPVLVEDLNIEFISNELPGSPMLTKECLNRNFNKFITVLASRESIDIDPAIYVGDGIEGNPGYIQFNNNHPDSAFYNNPDRLSLEEIKKVYLTNLNSADLSKFNYLYECNGEFFEQTRDFLDQEDLLYHKNTKELVFPHHLSSDQFLARGFSELEVSNKCMERVLGLFMTHVGRFGGSNGYYSISENNPYKLSYEQIDKLFESNQYKGSYLN